ncbi:unnamed protein product [Rhodiola kirilowii]
MTLLDSIPTAIPSGTNPRLSRLSAQTPVHVAARLLRSMQLLCLVIVSGFAREDFSSPTSSFEHH